MPNAKTTSNTIAGRARSAPLPYLGGEAGAAPLTAPGAAVTATGGCSVDAVRVVAAATLGAGVAGPRGATFTTAEDGAGGAGRDGAGGDGAVFAGVEVPTVGVGRARSVGWPSGRNSSGERSSPAGATTIG